MKYFLLIGFLTSTSLIKAQSACSPTYAPTDIFYPNSTSTATTSAITEYLCGPNTVVYDTLGLGTCHKAYLNPGTTLIFKETTFQCSSAHQFWLKGNAVLVLKGSGSVIITKESSATVNNLGSVSVFTTIVCPTITYPFVNCSVGINEFNKKESLFRTYPNPTSSTINIEFLNTNHQPVDIRIVNQLGEIVYENKQWSTIYKEIPIEFLSNGSYLIRIKTNLGEQTEKLIVIK